MEIMTESEILHKLFICLFDLFKYLNYNLFSFHTIWKCGKKSFNFINWINEEKKIILIDTFNHLMWLMDMAAFVRAYLISLRWDFVLIASFQHFFYLSFCHYFRNYDLFVHMFCLMSSNMWRVGWGGEVLRIIQVEEEKW